MPTRENIELYHQATDAFNRRDLGDFTLAVVRARGHGAGSDTPLDQKLWQVLRWQDGKCVWRATFETEAHALEAIGVGPA